MTSKGDLLLTQADSDRIEQAAATRIDVVRPTPPPFAWAEPFVTAGVTGTNGKTSTTYLIAHALRASGVSVLTETTVGYRLDDEPIDVPRTVRGYLSAFRHGARSGCRHAAVEVTSQGLARGFAKMWRFDVGVFTNLSRDHLSVHGSWEHYLASKAQLFVHLGPGTTAVLNACDESSLLVDRVTPQDVKRIWYGVPSRGACHHAPDLAASEVAVSPDGTHVVLKPSALAEALGGAVDTRFIGRAFAENALAAAGAALGLGAPGRDVREGLRTCPVAAGRFEIVSSTPLVAVDFAHTPDALEHTCATARELTAGRAGGRVIVVFGAGGDRDHEKREPMGRAVGSQAEVAIVTNDNPRGEEPMAIAKAVAAGCRRGGRAHVRIELDRRKAIEQALAEAKPDEVVVIAGKGHESGQEIHGEIAAFSDRDEVRRLLGLT